MLKVEYLRIAPFWAFTTHTLGSASVGSIRWPLPLPPVWCGPANASPAGPTAIRAARTDTSRCRASSIGFRLAWFMAQYRISAEKCTSPSPASTCADGTPRTAQP